MSGFKRGIEKAGMGSVSACICVLNSLKFRLLPNNHPREWRVGLRFLRAHTGLLVDATMIALFEVEGILKLLLPLVTSNKSYS